MAADLSCRLELISKQDFERVKDIIQRAQLPVFPPAEMSAETFISLMSRDKKAEQGRIKFILLEQLGKARAGEEIDQKTLASLF